MLRVKGQGSRVRGLLRPLLALAVISLAACAPAEDAAPVQDIFSAVPWGDQERARYSIYDGDELKGTGELTIQKEGTGYRLSQAFESEQFLDNSSVMVNAADFKPTLATRTISDKTGEQDTLNIEARYQGNWVEVRRWLEPSDEERIDRLAMPVYSYDSSSDIFLWRTIPFRQGYRARYNDMLTVVLDRPADVRVTLEVAGQESVEVPAGRFQAWRLEIRSGGREQVAWYAVQGTHPLVKYDNGDVVFVLESLEEGG